MSSVAIILLILISLLFLWVGFVVRRSETIGRSVFGDRGLLGSFDQDELGERTGPLEMAQLTRGIRLSRDASSGRFRVSKTAKYDSEYYR